MKDYPKKACPVCGEMISTHHLAWQNHAKTHGELSAISNAAISAAPVAEEISDPDLKRRYEEAIEMQKRFARTPQIIVGTDTTDEMQEVVKLYLPEAYGPNPTKHAYFGKKSDIERDISKGYVPVLNEKKDQVAWCGMLLYWIPQSQYEMKQEFYGKQSEEMLRRAPEQKNLKEGIIEESFEVEHHKKMEDI